MDFLGGACALTSETTYLLCFGFDFLQTCYQGDSGLQEYSKLPAGSAYEHKTIRIASSFELEKVIAVGKAKITCIRAIVI